MPSKNHYLLMNKDASKDSVMVKKITTYIVANQV